MGKVASSMSMSLDGYVTGPHDSREHRLGEGGEVLHRWLGQAGTQADHAVLQEMVDGAGAILMGHVRQGLAAWRARTANPAPRPKKRARRDARIETPHRPAQHHLARTVRTGVADPQARDDQRSRKQVNGWPG